MSRVGVTAILDVLIGLVAVVVAGMVLGSPGSGRSLALAVLTSALVVWVPGRSVVSATRAVGWEVSRPLSLLGGAFLMATGTLAGILLARRAWRRDVTPMVSVMGTTFGLLLALIGAALWLFGLSLFPGPVPSIAPPVDATATAGVHCSGC